MGHAMVAKSRERVTGSLVNRVEDSREDTWSGHLPIAQRRLLSIIERGRAGAHDFALAERSLFVICEFWAAVVARDLATDWRSRVDESLHALVAICAAIGLSEVAEALAEAGRDLNGPLTAAQRHHRLRALEEQLLGLNTPLDQIIAAFAQDISPVSSTCASWLMSSALSGTEI
jgi:hypothetical protein